MSLQGGDSVVRVRAVLEDNKAGSLRIIRVSQHTTVKSLVSECAGQHVLRGDEKGIVVSIGNTATSDEYVDDVGKRYRVGRLDQSRGSCLM